MHFIHRFNCLTYSVRSVTIPTGAEYMEPFNGNYCRCFVCCTLSLIKDNKISIA